MTFVKATHQETKKHNRDLVLKIIFEQKTTSRAEIARTTELTRTTVSEVVANLLEEGLVREVGMGSSIGGKSPILLSLVNDSRFMISLNLAYDQFCGAIVNLRGEIKEMESLPVSGRDGDQALAIAYEILDRLIKLPWPPLIGIGVGTPGLINTREGMIVNAVNLDWQNLPLAQLLGDRYPLPVQVLNDSQEAAIGEFVYGGGYPPEENRGPHNRPAGHSSRVPIKRKAVSADGAG